jgi:hypothetical protein
MESERQKLNIVLVYLRNKPPKYVIANLRYLTKQFPNYKTWLITDLNSVKKELTPQGFNVWVYRDNNKAWREIYENMNFPKKFRGGFWFLTLKRFKALEEFMNENSESVLHVEADVFLMTNFPIEKISRIEKNLAFPLVGKDSAIASTLYIRNLMSLEHMNRFITSEAKKDINLTDMTALFRYSTTFPDFVTILPSGPASDASEYFDGAAFGTYLLGQDPRNRRGYSLKYSPVDWHSDKIENLDFKLERAELFVINGTTQTPIVSLHIHSKIKKLFTSAGMLEALKLQLKNTKTAPNSS